MPMSREGANASDLFCLGDLLVSLVPQLRQNSLPVCEALSARQAHRHLAVGDLAIVNRMFYREQRILDEAAGTLVTLFAADACFECENVFPIL